MVKFTKRLIGKLSIVDLLIKFACFVGQIYYIEVKSSVLPFQSEFPVATKSSKNDAEISIESFNFSFKNTECRFGF
jgi:hypothetical protein